jgi:hypothetical protein
MNVHYPVSEPPQDFAVVRAGCVRMARVEQKSHCIVGGLAKRADFFGRLHQHHQVIVVSQFYAPLLQADAEFFKLPGV